MSSIYRNRELSWLKFNERVLEEAAKIQKSHYVERLTFASIYQTQSGRVFHGNVGSIYDQTLLDKRSVKIRQGMTSQEQIDAILKRTKQINKRKEGL